MQIALVIFGDWTVFTTAGEPTPQGNDLAVRNGPAGSGAWIPENVCP